MQLQVPVEMPSSAPAAAAEPSTRGAGRLERLLPVWAYALAAVTAVLAVLSLRWGIVHDASLMFFMGREVANGARTVTDVLDMNLPLVHWLHAGIWQLSGMNDLAWRLMDLALIGGIAAVGTKMIRPVAAPFAPYAILFLVSLHLAFGSKQVGQRDVMMLLPVLWAALLMIDIGERRRGVLAAALAGVALGIAAMLKPTAVVFAPIYIAALIATAPHLRTLPGILRLVLPLAAGFLVPCLIVAAVLHQQGSLIEFIAYWRDYMLPTYGRLRAPLDEMVLPIWWTSCGLALVLGAAYIENAWPRMEPRLAILVATVATGFISYIGQGKGYFYQAAPYVYPAILLAAVLAARVWREGEVGRRTIGRIGAVIGIGQILAVGLYTTAEIARGLEGPHTPTRLVAALAADIEKHSTPEMPVQTFDNTLGGLGALLATGRHLPSRFIYDFAFYIGGEPTPYQLAIRKELLDKLAAAGPHLLVVTNQNWPHNKSFERIDDPRLWPELHERVITRYRLVAQRLEGLPQGDQYRVYRSLP